MAHEHAHGEGEGTFFLDQLFTILAAGAVGLVAILMYFVVDDKGNKFLSHILVPMFFPWVLGGGVAILLMAVVRGVAVWQLAGQRRAEAVAADTFGHEHSHAGGDDCGHDHGHTGECDHDHSHSHAHGHSHASVADDAGHDHGWAPWRYMVIAVPVLLYGMGLPRADFSDVARDRQLAKGSLADPNRQTLSLLAGGPVMTKVLRKPQPETRDLTRSIDGKDGFAVLAETAAMPAMHEGWDGDYVILRGQYTPVPGSDREFTLVNWKMTCCRADAIVLEARIVAPEPVQIPGSPVVEVTGVVSFQQSDRGKWIPVITLQNNTDIKLVE